MTVVLGAVGCVIALTASIAVVGMLRTTEVAAVSRPTTASAEAIWSLWADVPRRTRWDQALEWARIEGRFREGATGEVKLRDQPPRRFAIIECQPMTRYTDRFFLPMGTVMDWRHSIEEHGDERQVTFRVAVKGPTSLILALVLRRILHTALPPTIAELSELAERS